MVVFSIMTGVATAFAARDILGNMLSGVSLQFSRPFTVGDSITVSLLFGLASNILSFALIGSWYQNP